MGRHTPRRNTPRDGYQKKRPLGLMSEETECTLDRPVGSSTDIDPASEYQDPYQLDAKDDDTTNHDNDKQDGGRERRARFDAMMQDFSERVQTSSRRQSQHASSSREAHDQNSVVQREVCDKIECALKPFFMKHLAAGGASMDDLSHTKQLQQVLARCGAKKADLRQLLGDSRTRTLIYLPCVSTSYVRVTIVLEINARRVSTFVLEDGWRHDEPFANV